jgi:cell volume regulation protein A
MDWIQQGLLIGASVVFAALAFGALSQRAGVPLLLVFLVVGMLAGEDGPGGIPFDDHETAFLVGNLALAVILLDGGLRTRIATFRAALWPSLTLATVGVAITAGLTGAAAVWLFGFDWPVGLLVGAIVGSTDAAAVFALLKAGGLRLSPRVGQTLEIESGANDPMAVFLTVTLIAAVTRPQEATAVALALDLARQFGVGLVAGLAGGEGLSRTLAFLRRRGLLGDALQSLWLVSGGVAVFAATNLLGGSGFLAVYVAGLVAGNRRAGVGEDTLRALDGLAWLAQCGMFLLLGLLVTPRNLVDSLAPALVLSLLLMLVLRPAMVAVVLPWFRFSWREIAYIGWVGLRGAVPIVLAVFPFLAGVPDAAVIFEIAFVVAIASLLLQGTTVARMARALRVTLPTLAEPTVHAPLDPLGPAHDAFVQFRVAPAAPLAGVNAGSVDWPAGARPVNVVRGDRSMPPHEAGPLAPCDMVGFIAGPAAEAELAQWFREDAAAAWHAAFGDFELDGDALLADVAALYGATVPTGLGGDATLADALRRVLGRAPAPVDVAVVGGLRLSVSEMAQGRITRVGLRLPRTRSSAA